MSARRSPMRAKYIRAKRQNIRESQDAIYATIVKEQLQRERQERERQPQERRQ